MFNFDLLNCEKVLTLFNLYLQVVTKLYKKVLRLIASVNKKLVGGAINVIFLKLQLSFFESWMHQIFHEAYLVYGVKKYFVDLSNCEKLEHP
jgi:hypothetical protein